MSLAIRALRPSAPAGRGLKQRRLHECGAWAPQRHSGQAQGDNVPEPAVRSSPRVGVAMVCRQRGPRRGFSTGWWRVALDRLGAEDRREAGEERTARSSDAAGGSRNDSMVVRAVVGAVWLHNQRPPRSSQHLGLKAEQSFAVDADVTFALPSRRQIPRWCHAVSGGAGRSFRTGLLLSCFSWMGQVRSARSPVSRIAAVPQMSLTSFRISCLDYTDCGQVCFAAPRRMQGSRPPLRRVFPAHAGGHRCRGR